MAAMQLVQPGMNARARHAQPSSAAARLPFHSVPGPAGGGADVDDGEDAGGIQPSGVAESHRLGHGLEREATIAMLCYSL